MVCDGVGGKNKGEVASRLACDAFINYWKQNHIKVVKQDYLQNAISYIQNEFELKSNKYQLLIQF